MYHIWLNICLLNISQQKLDFWQKIQPKRYFEHNFQIISGIEDIPSKIPNQHQYLIIISNSNDINISEIRERIKENGIIIIYAKNTDEILPKWLEIVDDVWFDSSNNLDKFYFEKTLELIAKRKESWLQKTWLQATINTLPDMIWFKNLDGLYLEINNAFCKAANKEKDDIRGKNHYDIWNISKEIYEKNNHTCIETEEDVIAARRTCLFNEKVVGPDGNLSNLKTYKTPIFDGEKIIGTVGIARDITKEQEYIQKIERLAHHDQLTNLANRNQLDYFLEKLKTTQMCIVYMDLDNFKQVNDIYGHQSGDSALMMTANLIQEIFPDALNVRIGGDEFISIFTDGSVMEDIPDRVQSLIDSFYKMCQKNIKFKHLSISAGIAEGKIGHGSFNLLLQRADSALYKAKREGHGKFYISRRSQTQTDI
jgi:fog: ggdef domain protein